MRFTLFLACALFSKPRKKRSKEQEHVSLCDAPYSEVQQEIFKQQSQMRSREYERHEAAVQEILRTAAPQDRRGRVRKDDLAWSISMPYKALTTRSTAVGGNKRSTGSSICCRSKMGKKVGSGNPNSRKTS